MNSGKTYRAVLEKGAPVSPLGAADEFPTLSRYFSGKRIAKTGSGHGARDNGR